VVVIALFCIMFSRGADASVNAEPIRQLSVTGLFSISKGELLYLLDLKEGDVLDRKRLRKGLKRAFLKGIFEDLRVESLSETDDIIHIAVKEKGIVDDIAVEGSDHFSKRFIRKHLRITTGERLTELKTKRAVASLKRELEARGFPAAEVSISTVPRKENRVGLRVAVTEGPPLIIEDIEIVEPEDVVRSFLRLEKGDILDRTEIERLSQKVREYYKKRGYIKTSLSDRFDNSTLYLTLTRGQHLTVNFQGNEAISTKALREELTFFEIDDFSMDLLEEAVMRIVTLYRKRGYVRASVAPAVAIGDDTVTVDCFIFEGERYRVGTVGFEGAALPAEDLRKALLSRTGKAFNADDLDADVERLRDYYRSQGYREVDVTVPEVDLDTPEVDLRFTIREGRRTVLRDVAVRNNNAFTTTEVIAETGLETGTPYGDAAVSHATRKILELYQKKGFLDASVTPKIDFADTSATVTFTVEERGVTLAGKTITEGNEITKREIITRELTQQEGMALNYPLLIDSRYNLYRTGLFTDINVLPVEEFDLYPEEKPEVAKEKDILYRLKEGNPGIVEFGVGYGEYEKFRGFLDVTYKNLWGLHRQISFRTELSTLIRRVYVSYVQPWFMVKDLTFKAIALYQEKEELNFDTHDTLYQSKQVSLRAGVEKLFTERLKAELYFNVSRVDTFDVAEDVVLSKEDTGHLLISGPALGIVYDRRDNPFDPKGGYVVGGAFQIASSLFFSQTEYAKFSAYFNHYTSLAKRLVLALSLRSGIAEGFGGTSDLPIVERFFLGGRTTVRGYAQDTLGPKGSDGNPTGGNAFAMFNLELRTDVGKGLGFITFLDGGNVWQKISEMDVTDLKYTTGLGLTYATPVGPVSVAFGYKLNREEGESRGELHFSLGYTF
jgi:outer membrane protein insertion porin family